MKNPEPNYYDVLGVAKDADEETIKNAYHKLAMHWHPDRNTSVEAEEKFKLIAKAYAILKDPEKRARYDAQGPEGIAHYTPEDLFGGLDLGDIFGNMNFGYGSGNIFDSFFGRHRSKPAHGQDLRVSIHIPLEKIVTGGKETVRVSHPVICDKCHGYGTKSGKAAPVCKDCQGSGQKVFSHMARKDSHDVQYQQIIECPVCHGKGTIIDKSCKRCGGYGQVEKEEKLKVQIPVGIDEGAVLRVAGHGMPGENPDIPQGDLFISVFTQPHQVFQRQGSDLWHTLHLNVSDAVLGTRIEFHTLDERLKVDVPAGIQPDEILRLKGKGLPIYNGAGRGDIKLRIQVNIPTSLSAKQRSLYEKLKNLE